MLKYFMFSFRIEMKMYLKKINDLFLRLVNVTRTCSAVTFVCNERNVGGKKKETLI